MMQDSIIDFAEFFWIVIIASLICFVETTTLHYSTYCTCLIEATVHSILKRF